MMFSRERLIDELKNTEAFDIIVIGGGASGLGIAVDAASRGLKTALFEGNDFAKGTSSKSTKLAHGGVRYLAQGHIGLVTEALEERGILAKNARHLFKNVSFIIPNYKWWQGYYYTIGLKIYDLLSKRLSLGKSRLINKSLTSRLLPNLKTAHLSNGVIYHDGQFDDSRLAINLAQTAIEQGAIVLNYFKVTDVLNDSSGKNEGVAVVDIETNETYQIKSKCIINATGVFTDTILKRNDTTHKKTIVPSRGIHLVLDKSFLKSDYAILIPKTSDERVLFIIPWHNKVLVGTTDTPVRKKTLDPVPSNEEINFILNTVKLYLMKAPARSDILSVFAGLRPLAAPKGNTPKTKEVSRSHKIIVSKSNLITIVGGKWTTYRKMGEDVINKAVKVHDLPLKKSVTKNLPLHGNIKLETKLGDHQLNVYGSDKAAIEKLKLKDEHYLERIHPNYPYTIAEVVWAVQNEMARTVEDVLARRLRLLFLDARAAIAAAPKVAEIMANELNKNDDWINTQHKEFIKVAKTYLPN